MMDKKYGLLTYLMVITFVFASTFSACSNYDLSNYNPEGAVTGLKTFSSIDEINSFLESSSSSGSYYYGSRSLGGVAMEMSAMAEDSISAPSVSKNSLDSTESAVGNNDGDFSTTNIQVKGVDEADIVKTDGDYIYYVTNDVLYIVEAVPAEDADIVSEIKIEDGYISEIFINEDKLIAMGYETFQIEDDNVLAKAVSRVSSIMPYYPRESHSFLKIYDISDKEEPELEESISVEGNYLNSRMIGDYVYFISNKYVYAPFEPPIIYYAEGSKEVRASDIEYFDMPDNSYQLSIIIAVDLSSDDYDFSEKTILKGASQDVYVSEDNIYLTSQRYIPYYYEQQLLYDEVIKDELPLDVLAKIQKIESYDLRESTKMNEIEYEIGKHFESLDSDELVKIQKRLEPKMEEINLRVQKMRDSTILHRIKIDGLDIDLKASSSVPGRVLNQFSMDEYDGNLRIATTHGYSWDERYPSANNIYVLDKDLEIVGEIEDIAPKEQIYSVRFMGERAYMVTFRNIDPLFVIDLADPENPEILGKLKIPGYSDYLHPYDENHIIGFGKETETPKDESERVIPQGFKMAIFDVSDVENPKVMDSMVIGDRGSSSDILYDHKALLFSKERNLLVLPIQEAKINPDNYEGDEVPEWAYGDTVFQGAYVFDINLEDGFNLRGRVTHIDEDTFDKSGYWFYSNSMIRRALYIGDVLYTLSNTNLMAHDLEDLDEISDVVLMDPDEERIEPVYYVDDMVIRTDSSNSEGPVEDFEVIDSVDVDANIIE